MKNNWTSFIHTEKDLFEYRLKKEKIKNNCKMIYYFQKRYIDEIDEDHPLYVIEDIRECPEYDNHLNSKGWFSIPKQFNHKVWRYWFDYDIFASQLHVSRFHDPDVNDVFNRLRRIKKLERILK